MKVEDIKYRITYGDTDAAGVVYYANYLRLFEQGRTEFLRTHDFSVKEFADNGILFAVARAEVDYKAPAKYDDPITIRTELFKVGKTSIIFKQQVLHEKSDKLFAVGKITIVCIGKTLKPRRLPAEMVKAAEELIKS